MTTEAKEWAASVRVKKKMKAAASLSAGQTTSEQKPVSPVQAGQTESAPNDGMFQNILGMLGVLHGIRGYATACATACATAERTYAGFDRAKAKADAETDPRKLVCTRPCNEFKTGALRAYCRGKRCNWGHSLIYSSRKVCMAYHLQKG